MKVEARKEHLWLQRLVGAWEASVGDGAQEGGEKPFGTEQVRGLGDVWVVAEGSMQGPGGQPAYSIMTLGFDPARGRFVGTWVGSMMTHLWVYDGSLDATGDTLTLDTEGPRFLPDGRIDGTARYQDIIALDPSGDRRLKARMQGEDGTWQEIMNVRYRRIE